MDWGGDTPGYYQSRFAAEDAAPWSIYEGSNGLPPTTGGEWCPEEDSNLHDLAIAST